ncbi:MAG TPA: type II toxin-antitoxin system RelE/ParE family toxin [Chitinophagales bacterium]|nr:type II toxin-antitoxin system RelE/ParE family toxin [Chitinophagales bacterium]MCB0512379.1 type II toxin-antitoxin system RelE/ParE family toxin [Bacteroidota bacterium]HMU97496.1 type II toxin-antitoxin system RelE/ParE family toxin [Chitinophagales bacterium]HMV03821.1 type II toxin-antitoxin system RelE/ParE family toxin [Chitinophagales bacterium]HMW95279.1 type II toxin-antitoxin system RelE/ParE family toxin [Chitinophagales bacterium]
MNFARGLLEYWSNKTKSKTYSKKLNKLFSESINLLSEHPKIGRTTSNEETQISIVLDYLIFYEFNDKEIIVQSVWDARRDENKTEYDYT